MGSTEGFALAFKAWWAFRIALPNASFDRIGHPYHDLNFLPDVIWASLALGNLALHLTGIVIRRGVLRRAMLLVDVAWWVFLITQMFAHTTGNDVDIGFTAIIALIAASAYLEVVSDHPR